MYRLGFVLYTRTENCDRVDHLRDYKTSRKKLLIIETAIPKVVKTVICYCHSSLCHTGIYDIEHYA